jgi:hypothetical protein
VSAGKRIARAAATAFIAVNIWTGAPLLALWIGSRAVGTTTLSMSAVIIVVGALAATDLALGALLAKLNRDYREMLGTPPGSGRARWLRSSSGESDDEVEEQSGVTLIERIVVISVYVAVGALLVWFVFLAGSPLPA